MNGQDLYLKLSKRDYTGSPQDNYAQLLGTIFLHIQSDIFKLLEQADKLGKKLKIERSNSLDEYTIDNITLV